MCNCLTKGINFLLYSNIYIALCAVAMCLETYYVLDVQSNASPILMGLVFFSTLFIYAAHRLASLQKVDKSLKVDRFQIISTYKNHIFIYAIIGALGGGICFGFLNFQSQVLLFVPALLSIAYILPLWGRERKRLRDVNFLKIFLIAIVWACVTVALVVSENQQTWNLKTLLVFIERCLFIFAITLPFDLRDREIDQAAGVLTLSVYLGEQRTIYLAHFLLLVSLGISAYIHPNIHFGSYLVTQVFTALLIQYAAQQNKDYYFTALIDGTMWFRPGWVIFLKESFS